MRNLNWQPLAALSLVMLAGCGDDTASSPADSADVAAFEKSGRSGQAERDVHFSAGGGFLNGEVEIIGAIRIADDHAAACCAAV